MRRLALALLLAGALAGAILLVVAAARPSLAFPGTTERVSVDSAGNQADKGSECGAISGDGRYVAFTSPATNLVTGDTNDDSDIFVHDRQTGETTRVSVDSAGNQASDSSWSCPDISTDGRYVAFSSDAGNLVAGDTNGAEDVFVHDRQTGITERVSVDSAGNQGNGDSGFILGLSISADGCYVAFESHASNLVPSDTNGNADFFVHDRQTGITERVSVDSAGNQTSGGSYWFIDISAEGRYVAFESGVSNLVAGDTNAERDIFVHDRQTGQTTRVSVDSAGNQANDGSEAPTISAEGRYVAFQSLATNLVASDTNGKSDIFVHDRQTGETTRVSVDSAANQANDNSHLARIADARYVAFESAATNLVPEDTNGKSDIFVHDRQTGETTRVSVNTAGEQANGVSSYDDIRPGARYVVLCSSATNLVEADTNGKPDIFVHDRGPGPPVGGIADLPRASGSSAPNYIALAGIAAATLVALTAGAWYARRQWLT
jgi:Tol biopolymer transport system component